MNTALPCFRASRLFSGTSTGESWPKCSRTVPFASRTIASTEKWALRVLPFPSKRSPSSGISATSVYRTSPFSGPKWYAAARVSKSRGAGLALSIFSSGSSQGKSTEPSPGGSAK